MRQIVFEEIIPNNNGIDLDDFDKEVIEFIHKRFPDDCNWKNGNCYFFALILVGRFRNLKIYHEPVIGHFMAGDGERFYDFSGRINPDTFYTQPELFEKVTFFKESSDDSYNRALYKSCIN